MKTLIYLSIAIFGCITSICAQSSQQLQGNWKIEAFEMGGIYFEFQTGKVKVNTADMKEKMAADGETFSDEEMPTDEDSEMLAEMIKVQVEPYYTNFMKFDGDKIIINYGGKQSEGLYKIKEQDGKKYLEITYTTGKTKSIEIVIKENLLSIPSEGAVLIYKLS